MSLSISLASCGSCDWPSPKVQVLVRLTYTAYICTEYVRRSVIHHELVNLAPYSGSVNDEEDDASPYSHIARKFHIHNPSVGGCSTSLWTLSGFCVTRSLVDDNKHKVQCGYIFQTGKSPCAILLLLSLDDRRKFGAFTTFKPWTSANQCLFGNLACTSPPPTVIRFNFCNVQRHNYYIQLPTLNRSRRVQIVSYGWLGWTWHWLAVVCLNNCMPSLIVIFGDRCMMKIWGWLIWGNFLCFTYFIWAFSAT